MKLTSVLVCDFFFLCCSFASSPKANEPTIKIDDGRDEDNEEDSCSK